MLMIRRVVGESMLPAFAPGSIVVGWHWRSPRVGSVVIARTNEREIIKRVAQLGPDGYFLLGDNASLSTDSRQYGWFSPDRIKGVIIGKVRG